MTERMDLEVTPRTSHEHVRMLLDMLHFKCSDVSKCRDEKTLPLGGKANKKYVKSQLAS
jgi:hypothetical protein